MLASLQLLGPGGSVSRVLHDPQRLLVRGKGSVAQVLRAWERGGMVRSSQLRGHTGGGCGRGGGSSTPNSLTPLTCMAWRCCPSFKFSAWNCLFFTLAFSRVAREFLTCQKSKRCRQHASPDDHVVGGGAVKMFRPPVAWRETTEAASLTCWCKSIFKRSPKPSLQCNPLLRCLRCSMNDHHGLQALCLLVLSLSGGCVNRLH